MPHQPRPQPFFIGESTALDFLNSVATPKSTEFDWLETGSDLLDWFALAGLASEEELRPLRGSKDSLAKALQDVRAFRDEFREFISEACGSPHAISGHPIIAQINRILRDGKLQMQIENATGQPPEEQSSYNLVPRYRIDTPHDLLPRIVSACAQLICEADFRYVKNCEGPSCTMYFQDVSKNHKRRWCMMEVCGNRAKAAAYRKR